MRLLYHCFRRPAKLEGKDKGNLISIITSDIELLEVFYAHTISPVCIALLFSVIMISFIGSYHMVLGAVALLAYVSVGILIPLITSRLSDDQGARFRKKRRQSMTLYQVLKKGMTPKWVNWEIRCPAVNGSAWVWQGHSFMMRPLCCWMNRLPIWTV